VPEKSVDCGGDLLMLLDSPTVIVKIDPSGTLLAGYQLPTEVAARTQTEMAIEQVEERVLLRRGPLRSAHLPSAWLVANPVRHPPFGG
jgi:hypothetical protein